MTTSTSNTRLRAALACLGLCLTLATPAAKAWNAEPTEVTFTNDLNVELKAQIFMPTDSAPVTGRPAVVMMHGCSGIYYTNYQGVDVIGSQFREWADTLTANGVVVMLVDSLTTRGLGSQCGNGAGVGLSEISDRPYDALAARRFLVDANLLQVDASRIGLMGWSHGGSTVLATLATRKPVQSSEDSPLATGSPFRVGIAYYPGGGLSDSRCTKYKADGSVQTTSCYGGLSTSVWDSYAPLYVYHGAADQTTSPGMVSTRITRAQASVGGNTVALTLYTGAGHSFDEPGVGGGACTSTAVTPNQCAKLSADASVLANLLSWLMP